MVDTLFGLSMGMVAGFMVGIVFAVLEQLGLVAAGWDKRMGEVTLSSILLGMAGSTLYHTLCEGLHGATFGKLVFGLRVVGLDGRASGLWPALVRNLWYFIDSLFFGLLAHAEMKRGELQQRLGDKRARTVVVRASAPGEAQRPGGLAFVLALALGMVSWSSMVVAGTLLKVRLRGPEGESERLKPVRSRWKAGLASQAEGTVPGHSSRPTSATVGDVEQQVREPREHVFEANAPFASLARRTRRPARHRPDLNPGRSRGALPDQFASCALGRAAIAAG